MQETIWNAIDDTPLITQLQPEFMEFENLFAAKEVKAATATVASNEQLTAKKITFLDAKRSQNCNIMLKAIKLSPIQIIKGLEALNTEVLPRHVLAELLKFIPTDEEVRLRVPFRKLISGRSIS